MQKNNTVYSNLKQIEQLVWRQLQETFSKVMKNIIRGHGSSRLQKNEIKNAIDSLIKENII